jgi:hypothetical protein
MAYSDFTMTLLNERFGLEDKKLSLFPSNTLKGNVKPRQRLLEDIADAKEIPIESEKSKSEHLITPVLKEVWHLTNKQFVYYSGYSFEVNKKQGLTGICDYLLSKEQGIEIKAPIFCLVEAKHRTIAEGIPQAFAEMYAAHIFNEKHHKNIPFVYGCVTDGTNWRFLKLEGKNAYIDTNLYHIEHNLNFLLEILTKIANP